jgi:diacylglycerol kinase (ATP)
VNTDKIAFLLNPSSGTRGTQEQMKQLTDFLQSNNPGALYLTKSPEEMRELAKDFAQKNYKAVFACGGDGTLNLVSSQLLESETALGIIPLGSGNGFARHHNIPLRWNKAIQVVENPKITVRDTGLINGIHFVNVAGIGFAAKISHAFKNETKRGLSGYAKAVIKNLKMEPFNAVISNENGNWAGDTWMVDFCNGSQWGNNFRISPGSRDDDGAINAVIFKKINPIKIPVLGFRFANNSVPDSPDVYSFSGAGFQMQFEGLKPLHVDGEAVGMVENLVQVQVLPKSLHLWTF